jgi:uroporphyrinogen decarboxylase
MLSRRHFLATPAAALLGAAGLTKKERVNRALAGQTVDRLPFTLWHHFGLEKQGPVKFAEATLNFHRRFATDLVKVMSDFPYPKPAGAWTNLKVEASPFAVQVHALEIISDGLRGSAHFLETVFNPWTVAEKLSSKEEVMRLKNEQPQKLLDALEVIAKSEANHAKLALKAKASGIFLAIANAQEGILTPDEYKKFSEPFDRMILKAADGAPLNTLHLHGETVYVSHFLGWPAAAINYGDVETGFSLAKARASFGGLLLGGTDERNYRSRTVDQLKADAARARQDAGAKLVFTPGCSVPNDSTPDELLRMKAAVGA